LLICDEVQTGFGRTGKFMAHEWDLDEFRPDIITLGKSMSAGVIPVSGIVANNEVMDMYTPGTHGSTFGGNPLAMAVANAALDVLIEEDLTENSL